MMIRAGLALLAIAMLSGCTAGLRIVPPPAPAASALAANGAAANQPVRQAAFVKKLAASPVEQDSPPPVAESTVEPLPPGESESNDSLLTLDEVVDSVYSSYPSLEAALYQRDIAWGNHLAARGAFDLKLKAASENGPLGFYQTYRQSVGLVQPLYGGSEVWGGYRVGRGSFQPWYLERQTNDGGEFKAGVTVPLVRNRRIDDRRADLWRTDLDRQLADFDIRAQLIDFLQQAAYAYWDWVAAGQSLEIAQRVLDLADSRTERIKRQVESGLIDPPELTDNERLVAERRVKVADARRKLQQQTAKLSLFLRDVQGNPILPAIERLPPFPEPKSIDTERLNDDVAAALANRPELQLLETIRQQLEVDRAQACNEMQPDVSAVVWGSQDAGAATSSKRDKSPFEMEAGVYVDVPLQRRKALGKLTAIEGKMRQLAAKQQLAEDKISVDVQTAYAALDAAYEQVEQARQAVALAEELAERERRNFDAGASDLLKVTLREQYAAESATKEVEAMLQYYRAEADYRAALAATPAE